MKKDRHLMFAYSIFYPFKFSYESFFFWIEWILEDTVFSQVFLAPTAIFKNSYVNFPNCSSYLS